MVQLTPAKRVLFTRVSKLIGLGLYVLFACFSSHPATVNAATSSTINFQARLMTSAGAIAPDGNYNVEFKLYNASTSTGSSQGSCTGDANCLWTETRTTTDKVHVSNGYLTVNLGSVTAFPSTINWDQQLWLTMNIGGTGTVSWDGEMSPRLQLTAVPYAFRAGQLATLNGANTSTLSFVQPTANRTILLPDESGTVCLQSSTNCGFALSSGSTSYIQNQNSSDQTANFRISGTGQANTSLLTPLLDTATATTLSIGTSTATGVSIASNNVAHTIHIADGGTSTNQTVTIGSTFSGSTTAIRGGTGASAISLTTGTNGKVSLSAQGTGGVVATTGSTGFNINTTTNSDYALSVQDSASLYAFSVSTNSGMVTIGALQATYSGFDETLNTPFGGLTLSAASNSDINITSSGTGKIKLNTGTAGVVVKPGTDNTAAFQIQNAAGSSIFNVDTSAGRITQTVGLRLSVGTSTVDTFTTPAGSSVGTAINIPLYNPGAYGQLLAFGLPSTADTTARAISVFDARSSGVIQPAIALFSPNENDVFGLSWNGLNTTASLETSSAAIALRPGGTNVKLWAGSTGVAIGSNVSSASYPLDVTGDVNTSTQYRIAGTVICTSTGCTPAAGSGNYIQNTTTLQSANIAVQAASSGSVAAVLQANAAGAGDILDLRNGAGTNIATFGSTGAILFKNSTNSTTAFDVQNAAGASVLTVDTTNKRVGIGNNTPTVDLDVGPGTLGASQVVQIRIGDFLLQSQQGGANGLAALTSRGSNGNLTIDGASGGAVYLNAFTTNNTYLAYGGGKVAVGSTAPTQKFEVQGGDAAIYNSGNNTRLIIGDSSTSGQYGYLQWDSTNDYFRIETAGTNGLKINDNFVTIGNIFPNQPLTVANGTTQLFQVTTTGTATLKTSTNSTTAFQVQNAAAGVAFNVDTTNKRVGIGGVTAPAVSLDVSGAIQQTGLQTSDTDGTDAGKWTQLGTCTITAQYQQCLANISIIGGHDGNGGDNTYGGVKVRVKQQNALGGVPYINIEMDPGLSILTRDDISTVTTTNNGTTTVVQLWGKITNSYEHWFFTPIMNTGNGGSATWTWLEQAGFSAALPGGTVTQAQYADGYVDSFTLLNRTNSTTALQIQNNAGTNAFSVDTTNLRVAVGGTFNPQETVDVVGNLQVRDATTATKSYRLRTSGGSLDFEASGADLYLSTWSGAGYTGTQYNQIIFKSDGSSMAFQRGFNVATGSVGLGGNLSPGYPLDVTGDINTSTQYRIAGTVICTSTGCTPAAGSGNYVQNTTTQQATSNFYISGTGKAATALQAPSFDAIAAGTLNFATANATTINVASNNVAHTLHIADGGTSTNQTVTIGSTFSGSTTTIQGGTGSTAINLTPGSGGNINLTTASTGNVTITPGASGVFIKPAANSTAAFQVSAFSSNNSVLRVDTTNERVAVGVISDPIGAKLSVATASTVALRAYQGGSDDAFQLGNATDDFLNISSTGNFLLKPTTNSTTAFRIQNAGGAATLFTVDTSGNKVQIGSSTTDTTAILLILDSYSTSSDPTGTAGAMYYSTAYNAMRCYQDGAWSNCSDPTRLSHGFTIQEDFLGSDDSNQATYCNGTTSISINYSWSCWTGGTATTGHADAVSSDAAKRPGQVQLATGANAAGNESLYLGGGTFDKLFIGGGETFETAINIPTLSNGTQTYTLHIGLCDNNNHSGDCTDGVYFEYASGTSANWRYATANGSTRTKNSSSKAVATGWTNLKFVATSSTSITFYAKSAGDTSYTSLGTITTNIPSSTSNETSIMFVIDKTVGTTERSFTVDYIDYWNDLTSVR